jgi:hypothetical protein
MLRVWRARLLAQADGGLAYMCANFRGLGRGTDESSLLDARQVCQLRAPLRWHT